MLKRGGEVGIATTGVSGRSRVRIPARKRNVSLFKNVQAVSGTHLVTCIKVTMVFPDRKRQG
jgi:hypothetical protein